MIEGAVDASQLRSDGAGAARSRDGSSPLGRGAASRSIAAVSVGLVQGGTRRVVEGSGRHWADGDDACGRIAIQVASSSSGEAVSVVGSLGDPGPRHEFVQTRGGPEIDKSGEDVGQISLRLDAAELAGFDQRSDAGPVLRALIMPREQRILAVEDKRTDASLDDIIVELDAAVVEEPRQTIPVIQGVTDVLCDRRFARDAGELLLEPDLERLYLRLAALLADGTALIGAAAPGRLLDGIESGDALERFARDRGRTVLDNVEEAPSRR